jgi:predicted PurR-regulated permease PerM
MNPEIRHSPIEWMRALLWLLWRLGLYALVIVGSVYVLGRLRVVIAYVIIAIILAYVMRPMATWVCQNCDGFLVPKRWSMHRRRSVATLYVLVLVFVGGYYSVRFMLTPFTDQIRDVSLNWEAIYKPRFDRYSADARKWYEKNISAEWRVKIEDSLTEGTGTADIQKGITAWIGAVARQAGALAHQIVEIVLLPVLAYYFALDSKHLKHEAIAAVPRRRRREVARMIHEFNRIMHSFVIGQAILCLLAGVVVWLLLLALNVPYALTLGVLAGVTRAIPIIGPILGGIPIIALTLVTAGMPIAIVVLSVFTIMHFVESKFVMPWLIGERMDLHPVVIIIVLLIGQEFGGLLGMFFAAPIASIIRVMVRRYYLRSHQTLRLRLSASTAGTAEL